MLDVEKFWSRVVRGDGCWGWTGAKTDSGYGVMRVEGRFVRAHRISYELANGPIPAGLNVCHTCDNPPCVRPDHLFAGSHADNVADKIAKGREFSPFRGQVQVGSLNRNSKLTEATVIEARARYAAGERLQDIAASVGVSSGNLHYAVTGRTWSHVPMPEATRPHWRRLTIEEGATIRARIAEGEVMAALAREYGVTPHLIHMIRDGKIRRLVA